MYNQSAIIEEILRKQQEAQESKGSPYNNVRKLTGKISKTGKNMTAVGDYMKDNLSNPAMQKLGANISQAGTKLSTGASKVDNIISPQNYFKGFAPRPFEALNQGGSLTGGASAGTGSGTIGATDAATQGAVGGLAGIPAAQLAGGTTGSAIGSAIGSEVAGTGSALGGSAIGNAIGAEIGGTAAGAGTGSAVGSAIGAEVGGTAAGTTAGGAAGGAAAGAGSAAAATGIGALVALGVMAAMGNHRKQAKKSSQQLLSSMNKEGEAALNQTQEFAKNAQNQDYSQSVLPQQGQITGGAAPVQQLSPIEEYQNSLREQGYSDDVINGVPQGLNSGYADIDNWIKQYNTGAGRDNPINIPQTEEEIAAAKAGNFNAPVQAASAEETLKQGLLDKFLSGISDFASGYQENRNNGFAPENLKRDDSKSKMNRVGEALGTAGRIAQNPLVQGLIAGGVSTALTGNPLYGVGQGYKFANARAMDKVYRDVLAQNGIDIPNAGTFGNIGSNDMRNIGNLAETHAWHEYLNNNKEAELARKIAKDLVDKEYKESRAVTLQQNADTNKYKAEHGTTVTHINNGGGKTTGSKSTSVSGQFVIGETPSGKRVKVPVEEVKTFKSNGGKIVG